MGPFDDLTPAQRQQIREAHATRKETEADRRWREGVEIEDRMHRAEERLAAGLREHIADETARRTGRGNCPVCGRDSRLTKAGNVWTHGADTGVWPPMNCAGSGQKPKEG